METTPPRKIQILIIAIAAGFILIPMIILLILYSLQQKNNVNPPKNTSNQYNWSAMEKGPYKDKVSFATGTSLTSWTDSGQIIATHASVPDVILKNGTLYVYFVDVSQDGIPEQIGLLRSTDKGVTWDQKQIITINGLGDKVAVDPAPYLMDDGTIRLYYFDISTTKTKGSASNTIYSAISSDGVNFTEEPGYRFSYPDIYDPDVTKVDDLWLMYVGTGKQQVLLATSTDGLTFTFERMALDNAAIPNIILENGVFYLYTGGIEISTSTDGRNFIRTGMRFDSGKLTADPGVLKIGENDFFLVYKTRDDAN